MIVRRRVREGNGQYCTPSPLSDHSRTPAVGLTARGLFAAAVIVAMACRSAPQPLRVAVTFANTWRVGGDELTAEERSHLAGTALDAMRAAFAGFDVVIAEAPSGARLIRVEDTPPVRTTFGAAGVTYPAARTSSVRFDVLANLELAVVHCRDLAHCAAMPRAALVDGLGRGVGATAAHELGHQAGFRFALDSRCDDCYDGRASTSYAHFFGRMHWSDPALQIMVRTLPRREGQTRGSTSPPPTTHD